MWGLIWLISCSLYTSCFLRDQASAWWWAQQGQGSDCDDGFSLLLWTKMLVLYIAANSNRIQIQIPYFLRLSQPAKHPVWAVVYAGAYFYNNMSYKAEIEICLHLHKFRNIQIDRQGYAAIRVQIYDESAPNLNYAIPYHQVPYHKSPNPKPTREATIEDNAYHSSTIKIQYADEKYYLNDIVQFKLLVQSLPKLQTSKIYLKLTLLFASLYSYDDELEPVNHGMEEVVLKLSNIEAGIFHYFEAEFTGNYASMLSFTLFAMITDFKLFPYSMRKQVIDQSEQERKREKEREKITNIVDLMDWSRQYVKNCQKPIVYFYENFAKVLRYNSYILRVRANQCSKNPKEVHLKLPKFYNHKEDPVSNKQFYEFFSKFDSQKISIKELTDEIIKLHEQNYFFSQELAQTVSKGLINYVRLQQQYKQYLYSQNNARIVKEKVFGHQKVRASHAADKIALADKIRKQRKDEQPYPIRIKDQKVEEYLFYEVEYAKDLIGKEVENLKNDLPFHYDERNMLIVLCHGFQATSYDMKVIQRGIREALPIADVYVSHANEECTEIDIEHMGQKLAEEVQHKIKIEGLNRKEVILNFVGHSMGGIISRAALKHLKEFEKQLGFFCSLSSPHLGYMNGTDIKIQAGLWVMRKMMKDAVSLGQLSMNDASKPENTFLYKLSSQGSLTNFRKVILVGSAQDSYVPWHSARICPYDAKSNTIQRKMSENILGDCTVHRIDVNFACKQNDIDGFIGRKAHIYLIVNESIFKLINFVLPKLFDLTQV